MSDDDPRTLRRFLQFLYTGNYDYGVTLCVNTPSTPALDAPEEVFEQLKTPPGVEMGGETAQVDMGNPAVRSRASVAADGKHIGCNIWEIRASAPDGEETRTDLSAR